MKNKKITKIEEMSIGQLYMYVSYNYELCRGYCSKLEKEKVTFDRGRYCYDDSISLYRDGFEKDIYEYNASIFRKYQKLLEQQKKEREDLLNGKPVVVTAISKEKWYSRFLRRKNNGTSIDRMLIIIGLIGTVFGVFFGLILYG